MPKEHTPAQVQVEYISEISTAVENQHEAFAAPDLPIQLVDKNQFTQRLREQCGNSFTDEDAQFWDVLFGNYPRPVNQQITNPRYHHIFQTPQGIENPHVHYLTMDSCEKIINHRLQFSSGIDFQHLPSGFLLTKNPHGGGVCDVLHFSEYYAKFQPKDNNHVLAITLTNQDELNTSPADALSFHGPQAEWYALLQSKRISEQGAYCTESQLNDAFIRFSNIIQDMGLEYYTPEFSRELHTESVNPIILLGRWETVLSNPRLKKEDRTRQWQALPQLPLATSHEAIRAITDYAYDQRPCGFMLPSMNLDQEGFYHNPTPGYHLGLEKYGFRSNDRAPTISGKNMASFWRYIAYQPKRNSIEFYNQALIRLNKIALNDEARTKMLRILAANTTRDNHYASTMIVEQQELEGWDKFCYLMEFTPTPGIRFKNEAYTNEQVAIFHQQPRLPNFVLLGTIVQEIENNVFYPRYLVILANRMSLLSVNLGNALEHGEKFYLIDNVWQKLSLNAYIELQYHFYRFVGGEYAVESMSDDNAIRRADRALSPKFTLLAPHLSTFNLLTMDDIKHALSGWPDVLSQENEERLDFCFELFYDIQTNNDLTSTTLAELIQYVTTFEDIEDNHWQLQLLDHLHEQFAPWFSDEYFEKKAKQIRDVAFGLTEDEITQVKACSFPEAATTAIISVESAIVQQNIPHANTYLTALNEQLVNLKHLITPEDFTLFTEQLNEMQEAVAGNYTALPTLIDLIIKKRTLEGFSQIFIRNDIEKSSVNLLNKFTVFIQDIKPLTQRPHLKLAPLALQETLATIVLNATSIDAESIHMLIEQLNQVASTHPQTRHYLLTYFNHMPDTNSEDYMRHVLDFGQNLVRLSQILEPSQDRHKKDNMFVIYSLIAHYHQRPIKLSQLMTQINRMPSEQQLFMIKFLSRLIDNNQSIDGLESLITLFLEDESKYQTFATRCQTPPYPNVETLTDWLDDNHIFEEKYAAFSLKPYGDRKLEYAFNIAQYKRQQDQFVGVSKIFTDETGLQLDEQLKSNRIKSIQALTEEFHTLRQSMPLSDPDKLKLVCLCVEMMARTASQLSHDTPPTRVSQELNTTQVMALYAKMVNPENRLISQIDTGEGKSRIMMTLAACQAAQGKTVDFLTSDMQLAERDYLSYKQFFTALNIPTSLISLDTPSQLYQKGGVNFTDNSQLLLLRNRSDIEHRPFAYLDERKDKRCLLVDEVDKFIHDKSKDSYNYAAQSKQLAGFVWIYPNLVKFIERLSLDPDEDFDPNNHVDDFIDYINQNVLNRMHKAGLAELQDNDPAQIKTWLRSAHTALRMKADKDYILTEPEKNKLYLIRDTEGHARYSRKVLVLDNGRPVEGSSFADGVHQCLCAKENIQLNRLEDNTREAFVIMPENKTLRASFPVSFMARYDEGSIYGVSGTTRSEAPLSNQDDINYEKYHYLIMPREKPLIREEKNTWLAKNEAQQIIFIKRSIIKNLKSNSPVLLICKDDQQSLRLHQALQDDEDFMRTVEQLQLQCVHGLTSKQDEIKAIQQAGAPGFVTISTAGMLGRGVDINADNLSVIAAYVPTEEDEIQIKGRTARMGKPGEYRMIPNKSDADYPLNGDTYNVHNEVIKSQKQRQRTATFQKEVSSLYALFLEDITQQFIDDCERCSNEARVERLLEWQTFLGNMQKDWEPHRQQLLDAVDAENQEQFTQIFNNFTKTWVDAVPVNLVVSDSEKQTKNINKIYSALMAQQRFFTPQRQPIKVQRDYDPSDDGQARVYSTLFPRTRATLRGERPLFADYHAWREGRGHLFPDLMATLHGERDLFATLYATISRWIEEWSEWLSAKKAACFDGSGEEPTPPEEGDLDTGTILLPPV
ncbi:MAG: hypothetical protein P1U36_04870 [Legionellaceae bacterium]|nr:hypothetical protein [Legionellaceae bacterium]